MSKERQPSLVDAVLLFESGMLDYEGSLRLFQELVDTGMAWRLQGSYGRMAQSLIDDGLITEGVRD